ncbi:hypothetical protein MRB53_039850 [Persea americana]|nr:hypothetical protein MRB53_039850 [Persea americana]
MSENESLKIAAQAEKDLNSRSLKTGQHTFSDSTNDSGVDEAVTERFPGSTINIGGTGSGDNRVIPEEEGGSVSNTGRLTKAKDFEGEGGPEDKQAAFARDNGGSDDVQDNVRQGGETRRP